jgi:carboxymethylenebutenolidase
MYPRTRHRRARPLFAFLALTASGAISTDLALARNLPPDEAGAVAYLDASPRHGEWVDYDAGEGDMVRARVVHPECPDAAPVVIVIHEIYEIYALTDWIRAVADQLAAEGFIAVAPGCRATSRRE